MDTTTQDLAQMEVMRKYIAEHCGIIINKEKDYLLEVRLAGLQRELDCSTFNDLRLRAMADKSFKIRDRIVDLMATKETLWFRDGHPYEILSSILLKEFLEEYRQGKRSKIRIWSAACSTGQEPYSIAIACHEFFRRFPVLNKSKLELIASDIAPTALFFAKNARYDQISISRGMPEDKREKYFVQTGKIWVLKDEIKEMVEFRKLNFLDDFTNMGHFDIIFCRYVMMYFSEDLKRKIISRHARMLKPGGYLIIGATESLLGHSEEFKLLKNGKGMYYQVL